MVILALSVATFLKQGQELLKKKNMSESQLYSLLSFKIQFLHKADLKRNKLLLKRAWRNYSLPIALYSVYSSTPPPLLCVLLHPSPLLYVLPTPLPPQPLLNISGFYTSAGYFWELNNLNLVLHPA